MPEIIDPTITQLIESSSQRDALLIVLVAVVATVWVIKQVIPLVQWARGDKTLVDTTEAEQREAFRIILQRDVEGQNVILGLPRMIRDFTRSMDGFTEQMRQLVNHQSETLKHLHETSEQTLRIVSSIRSEERDARRRGNHGGTESNKN